MGVYLALEKSQWSLSLWELGREMDLEVGEKREKEEGEREIVVEREGEGEEWREREWEERERDQVRVRRVGELKRLVW